MANRIWNALPLVVALGIPLLASAPAGAQDATCRPGDLLCGEVQIGPIEGRVRIGPGDAPPPPVVVQPPPVVIAPPPPPVVVAPPPPPPQPPVVVVQQPPPPVIVTRPAPQPQVVEVRVPRRRVVYDLVPAFDMGLHLQIGGIFSDRIAVGGGGAAFRIRPIEWFAIDLGGGIYGGQDYQGADRWEVPLVADLLFFFNPGDRFQFYALVGGGVSIGQQGSYVRGGRDFVAARDLAYVGGEAGIGLEWRIGRHFALNLDVRGFLREQVGSASPEFVEVSGGRTQTTNTSGGFTGNVGMTFYFVGL
jgi:hypothetical protein